MENARPQLYATLHNPVSGEVRHLIIVFRNDGGETQLVKLVAGHSESLAMGTQQETAAKADDLVQQWQRHGFEYCRARNLAPEPLSHFKALARLLGYTTLYDPRHKSMNVPEASRVGEVPLDEWEGVQGRNGGSYLYTLDGAIVHASPQLPPSHTLTLPRASGSDFADYFQRYKAALDQVGPHMEFTLIDAFQPR